ncbi:hypothetical protein, partial [Klebsiella oxytoca]|uniref:hypothetical protein n=1 Tax=Klebsiella oxytoca TaxID=571 RepID=UPI001CC9C7FC
KTMSSDVKCPFCCVNLIKENHCHICHAFRITGYIPREVRSKIKFMTLCSSFSLVITASFIAFLLSAGTVAYMSIFVLGIILIFAII